MRSNTLARWKVKYQRATSYIALGTFAIVLYGLVRDLHASPFFPVMMPFWMFVVIFFGLAAVGIVILADLDWRFIFMQEQAQSTLKNPLLYTIIFQSAWLLTHHGKPADGLEERLREAYRNVGVEEEFDRALRELRQ